jgi:hypothetical protein
MPRACSSPKLRLKEEHNFQRLVVQRMGSTSLIHVDTSLAASDLLSNRMAYVSVSRGQWDAQIFTNDRSALAETLGHDVSHKSAYQPKQAIAPIAQEIAETHAPRHDFGHGIDMVLGM